MLSQKAKVLQALGGRTMLNHVMTAANKISNKISVVVGFDKEGVEEEIKKIGINANTFLQKEQIGTADAVKTTLKDIDKNEKILILYGDVPLIKEETLKKLCNQESDLSILTTNLENPTGYGRALKDKENNVLGIIEEKDADSEQKKIKDSAEADIEQNITKAKEGLREEVAALVIAGAEQILNKEVDESSNKDIVDALIKEL